MYSFYAKSCSPYKVFSRNVRNSELFHASREKSRKTEGVFLVGSRGLRGEIEISPGSLFQGIMGISISRKQKKQTAHLLFVRVCWYDNEKGAARIRRPGGKEQRQ